MSVEAGIYLGTWQFEAVTEPKKIDLIQFAQANGITKFDTAQVYNDGHAEELLGQYAGSDAEIITKIPALQRKPSSKISDAYPVDHITVSIQQSRQKLGDADVSVLLHNWLPSWEQDTDGQNQVLDWLQTTASQFGMSKVGISLPNGYDGTIEKAAIYQGIDLLETPFNSGTPDVDSERLSKLAAEKTVLARSLFEHGKAVHDVRGTIDTVLSTGAFAVIGATKEAHIRNWLGS